MSKHEQQKIINGICKKSRDHYNRLHPAKRPATPDPTIDWEAYSKTRAKLTLKK